jgi:DNA-binding YbaB/EbfC family protein
MAKGSGGIQDLMKQAQRMQQEMMRIQGELATKTVEASSGGGMVTVVVNGKQELVSITIEPSVVDPDDVDMLQDLIMAAVNEGLAKSQDMVKEEMAKVTGGLSIPGLSM